MINTALGSEVWAHMPTVAAPGIFLVSPRTVEKVAAGLVPLAGTSRTGPPLVVTSVAVVAVLVMTPTRTPLASGAPKTPSEVMEMLRGSEDVKVPALGAVVLAE